MGKEKDVIATGWRRSLCILCVLTPTLLLSIAMSTGIAATLNRFWPVPSGGYGFDEDNLWRIKDFIQWQSGMPTARRSRLAVVVGSSSMRSAVSIDDFNRNYSPEWKVMGLCGTGAPVTVSLKYLRDMEQASLSPDHILVGLSPRNLLSHSPPVPRSSRPEHQENKEATSMMLPGRLLNSLSTWQRQVSLRSQTAFRKVRHLVYGQSGVRRASKSTPSISQNRTRSAFDPADRDPFREVIHELKDGVMQSSPPHLDMMPIRAKQLQNIDANVVEGAQELVAATRRWLRRGVAFTILLLPEGSPSRKSTVGHVREPVIRCIEKEIGANPRFRIVDLVDGLPDSAFLETFHIRPSGRKLSVPLLMPYVVPQERAN